MRPQEPSLEGSEGKVSRRKMLKRIGVGATTAWSLPVLRTVSVAHAAVGSECGTCDTCPGGSLCGGAPPGEPCFCAQRHEGGCLCASFDVPPDCSVACQTDADCGPLYVCIDLGPNCLCAVDQPTTVCVGRCPF
jgi:hypothetical protein